MHIAHLVGVHEARITHHVAAVGKVHGKDGPTAITDRAGAVVVEVLVVVGGNITSREVIFDPRQKLRVNGHDVFVTAVDRAFLDHPHLAVPLDDLGLDFAHLLVDERFPVLLAT